MKTLTQLLFLLLFLLPLYTFAQPDNLRFEKLEIPDVPNWANTIAMYEDSRGFMWFGTLSGLYMFDGIKVSHFINNPNDPLSISDNKVTKIVEDSKGNFWIGTQNGLNYLDIKKHSFKRYIDEKEQGIGVGYVRDIKLQDDKSLVVGLDNGLFTTDSTYQKFKPYTNQFGNKPMRRSFTSKHGIFLNVGSNNSTAVHFKAFKDDSFSLIPIPLINPIMKLLDDEGKLWIAGDPAGLFYINTHEKATVFTESPYFKDVYVHHIFKKTNEEIWVYYENIKAKKIGFRVVNLKTGEIKNYQYNPLYPQGINEKGYTNIFYSSQNIIWANPNGEDILTVDFHKHQFQNMTADLIKYIPIIPVLTYLYEYSPNHLLIRQNKKPGLLDILTGKITPFNDKPDYNTEGWEKGVACFLEENKDMLWIGNWGGLFLFNKKTHRFIQLEKNFPALKVFRKDVVRQIFRDKMGYLWVVTWGTGVYKIDFKNKTIHNYLNVQGQISNGRSIIETKKGQIWVGTRGGLCKYIPEADSFKVFKNILGDSISMSENTAFHICEDASENYLWVGTYGGGLNKFDVKTEKFKHFTTDNGLLDNNIIAIYPDKKNNLWLATFTSLAKFNPISETFQNFTYKNGLLNKSFNAFLFGKGIYSDRLFFASNHGIDYFYPDSIQISTHDPKIYITDLKLFNKTVAVGKQDKDLKGFLLDEDISYKKHLTLTHEQNVITFDYVALDYSAPKTIQYAYQLLGFDTTWQYVGNQRSATFTNLNPGDYTFNVKATNSDGVWGTKKASIKLTVLPPWWRTWWFRVLLFGTFLGIFISIYRYRLGQIKEKEDIRNALTKRIAEVKMEAVRSQMNPHFIFNALTSINLYILKNDTDTASFYLNKFSKLMRDVLDQSRADVIGMDEELNTLKIYVEIEKMRFKDNFNFIFDIDPNVDLQTVKIPPLILQPFVENAIWHGLNQRKNRDNTLIIKAFEKEGFVHIVIEDNGIGREKAMAAKQENGNGHTSHGLRLTFERLQYFNENYNTQATIETVDLKDDNQNPIGTRIVFKTKIQ